MKIFELDWGNWELGKTFLFSHENKSEKQFKADVNSLIKKYWTEYVEKEEGWIGLEGIIEYIVPLLVTEFGYQQTQHKIDGCYFFFGDSIILDKHHDDKQFFKIIGKENWDLAIAKNELINKRLNEEYEYLIEKSNKTYIR